MWSAICQNLKGTVTVIDWLRIFNIHLTGEGWVSHQHQGRHAFCWQVCVRKARSPDCDTWQWRGEVGPDMPGHPAPQQWLMVQYIPDPWLDTSMARRSEELKSRRDSGELNLTIRNRKIVKLVDHTGSVPRAKKHNKSEVHYPVCLSRSSVGRVKSCGESIRPG